MYFVGGMVEGTTHETKGHKFKSHKLCGVCAGPPISTAKAYFSHSEGKSYMMVHPSKTSLMEKKLAEMEEFIYAHHPPIYTSICPQRPLSWREKLAGRKGRDTCLPPPSTYLHRHGNPSPCICIRFSWTYFLPQALTSCSSNTSQSIRYVSILD